jgi:GT2 family glycosyltransferase
MRLSILIVNWNTSNLLRACLESIGRFAPAFDFEAVVVDNASADFDEPAFAAQFPNARFIVNKTNVGYAEGNNQAIAEATGEFVLLLNPDTELKDNSLSKLVSFMESHPEAAAAGCRLVHPDGTIDRSCRGFPEPWPVAAEFLGLSRFFPRSHLFGGYRMTWFTYDKETEVDQPMGSCIILSRRALADVGTLDQDFPIFFNEVDWCYRAKQAGWKIYFTPEAEVIHHGAAGTKQVRRAMRSESRRSLERFYRKHYRGRLFGPVYWFIVAAIRLSDSVRRGS